MTRFNIRKRLNKTRLKAIEVKKGSQFVNCRKPFLFYVRFPCYTPYSSICHVLLHFLNNFSIGSFRCDTFVSQVKLQYFVFIFVHKFKSELYSCQTQVLFTFFDSNDKIMWNYYCAAFCLFFCFVRSSLWGF